MSYSNGQCSNGAATPAPATAAAATASSATAAAMPAPLAAPTPTPRLLTTSTACVNLKKAADVVKRTRSQNVYVTIDIFKFLIFLY